MAFNTILNIKVAGAGGLGYFEIGNSLIMQNLVY